jgi:Cof subfamily protein (haloacid dehalogenase superfamily)
MDVKLIVADIDNTLVKKYGDVSEYTKGIISKARKQGILFGIASGRPLYHCKELINKWKLETDFLICNNGCNVYDYGTNKEYNFDFLKPEWCKEIIELMKPFDANIMIYSEGKNVCSKQDEMVIHAGNVYHYDYLIVNDISYFYRDIEKLMFRLEEDKMAYVEEAIKKHPSKYYKGFRTQPIMLEFCSANVSKGKALNFIGELNNIDVDNMCAFGDTENDEDMIEIAGYGVCMLNGSDSTKKIATYITKEDCAHDGVGHFIEDNIL